MSFELFVAPIVTTAEADDEELAFDVAFTFTVAGEGTVAGAVYRPPELMLPQLKPEQPAPLTLQVTAVLLLPVTLVWNCCWPLTVTRTLVGEIVTYNGDDDRDRSRSRCHTIRVRCCRHFDQCRARWCGRGGVESGRRNGTAGAH